MIERDVTKFDNADKNKRDFVDDISSFINGKAHLDGKVLVIYGLRRTGKTVAMEQALTEYGHPEKCAFFEVSDTDTIDDIYAKIVEYKNRGIEVMCFDEITEAEDFITSSAYLPDVFAKEGIKIILTGTDSLGFDFAEDRALFDRTQRIATTHISFSEHSRVLNTKSIDDYIEYGGLMGKGLNKEKEVHDYKSACKYLDSAVAGNISHSILNDYRDNDLDVFSAQELNSIIEKLVELYSGVISIKNMQYPLRNVSVNEPISLSKGLISENNIQYLALERKNIAKDFAEIINADIEIKTPVTAHMVHELEKYLLQMHVLSVVPATEFRYTEDAGWREADTYHEYYIVQPAIKYYHLLEGKKFISKSDYYKSLTDDEKKVLSTKYEETIRGKMIEQIVIYDVRQILSPPKQFLVTKPIFYVNDLQKGEYDMLIRDRNLKKYWSFEIKHTDKPYYEQEKHLVNDDFKSIADRQYGERAMAAVLYQGKSFQNTTGVYYLNVADFCLTTDKYKNISKTMEELTRNLPKIDLKKYNELQKANTNSKRLLEIARELAPINNILFVGNAEKDELEFEEY